MDGIVGPLVGATDDSGFARPSNLGKDIQSRNSTDQAPVPTRRQPESMGTMVNV